tara:strand:+ start:3207 stop:4361 length:1155 start_codon:yes stop_codon:yes gene_type:complete
MLTNNINFKNFQITKKNTAGVHQLKKLLLEKNQVLSSFSKEYKDSFLKKNILKFQKYNFVTIFGMGGSILGAKSIYSFLRNKIKKNFIFRDNYDLKKENKKKKLNLIISKSGNTLETITNANILISKNQSNIFITENSNSHLYKLAKKLKAEIVHHNNYIGGRYSVLSEVGMLPAILMGLNVNKFRSLNELIKNKNFINSLVVNVSNTLSLIKKKKTNSIILNYDEGSWDLFNWYQQLIAESLGKKGKGLMPIISNMPKDNHSLMQLYLDGPKNNFFTFFFVKDKDSRKIKENNIIGSHNYLKGKKVDDIKYSQYAATVKVFQNKKIPHRIFEIIKKNEQCLGELFTFFMLETILLGKAMNINPYNQPAVELIKKKTKSILINS